MLILGIHYLTGYAVATDTGDRNRAEWPPHPGRVFMALAAAWFETQPHTEDVETLATWEAEGEALRWLETLDAPEIDYPKATIRDIVDVYVPPNDMAGNKVTCIPAFRTNRQPRTFPKVRLPDERETVILRWQADPGAHHTPLARLCRKVIRIGHSSSFVQMWISETDEETQEGERIAPAPPGYATTSAPSRRLRIITPGCLDYLKTQYNSEAVDTFYDFTIRIQTSKGKEQKTVKEEFERTFGHPWKASLTTPVSRRPNLSMTQTYTRKEDHAAKTSAHSVFDDNLLILDKREGPVLGLESTWRVLTALRGAIESRGAPTSEWVNGHQPSGSPSEQPHLALLPLAYVGSEHADGHFMGVALAFPRAVTLEERGQLLGKLLYNSRGKPEPIRLTLGDLGVWELGLEERVSPPQNLRSSTWTGPKTTWASVSPVVLDRHPKSDPSKPEERVAYVAEVAAIIAESCQRIGLPEPAEIDIDKTSWHIGAPRAKPGPDGYPLMPARPGGPNRRQVHVWLRFEQPVLGPVLLGAGRYRGYGLCRPVCS